MIQDTSAVKPHLSGHSQFTVRINESLSIYIIIVGSKTCVRISEASLYIFACMVGHQTMIQEIIRGTCIQIFKRKNKARLDTKSLKQDTFPGLG